MATTTLGGGESAREARRRRITERGSDRLALITGRIQSLPAADSSQQQDVAVGSPFVESDSSGKEALNHATLNEEVEPLVCDSDQDIVSRAASLLGVEKQFTRMSSLVQAPLLQGRQEEETSHRNPLSRQEEQRSHWSPLTTGQIRSAITASENIRIYCSVAAAILVTLSYVGFPIFGWNFIQGIVLSRPLYLLLLTNVTIVLARLMFGTQRLQSKAGRTSSVSSGGGNDLFGQMGKALEVGLLLQNVSGAVFMDVGIYAVVLVCGLSLVRTLGF